MKTMLSLASVLRISLTLLAAAFPGAPCFALELQVNLATRAVVRGRLESGAVELRERQAAIRGLFNDVGCSTTEQRIDKHYGNVICTLSGQTDSAIMVGGHFDFVERGKGIVDDWTGASLLPSLYQALKKRPRRHTYIFVAFGEEEIGLVGSSRYVSKLTAQQKKVIRAFVNLECLGLGPANVWAHRSAPILSAYLNGIALTVGVPLMGVDVDRVGDDDTHPFVRAHIPVISIHSVTQATLPILHSSRDNEDAIHFDDYYQSYNLIAYYLAYLDAKIE